MFKKLITIICFISTFSFVDSSYSKDSAWYNMGKEAVGGVADGVSDRLSNSTGEDFTKFIKNLLKAGGNSLESKEFNDMAQKMGLAFQKMINQGFAAGGNSLESKEFTEMMKKFSKTISDTMVSTTKGVQAGVNESSAILRKTMDQISKELFEGMDYVANNGGKQMQQTFKKGGEIDRGMGQAVNTFTGNVNRAVQHLVHNNMMKASAIVVVAGGSYFILQYGIPFAFKMIERAWTRPKLIIESSQKGFWQAWFGASIPNKSMIFSFSLENRLNEIVQITSTIHKKIKEGKTNIKYRNLMLYGPPGTGKTLFATELAKRCGLEYVFMSGSSFSKFKDGEGIEALDELFAWANKTKGLLIFIDEAETFLLSRDKMDPQSKPYLLLNNFLNYTGTRSDKFMIVFATNHKDALDSAMYRRIDDLVEMPLPGKAERVRILNLYKETILMDRKQNESLFVQSVANVITEKQIQKIADATKGVSGSELEGIINSIKTSTDILDPAIVTVKLVDTVVEQAVTKHFTLTGGKFLGAIED
jgi:hypothetical protein